MTASPSFPQALAALSQWVCWRMEPDKKTGRTAKVPYNPHTGYKASASNPATWGTLAHTVDKPTYQNPGKAKRTKKGIKVCAKCELTN